MRESPQLSNLLDGEGFDIHDIQDQQIRQAKEIAKHLAVIQADGDAKILNTASKEPSKVNNNIADHTEAINDQSDVVSAVLKGHYTTYAFKQNDIAEKNKKENLDIVHQQNQDALLGMAPPPGLTQPSSSSTDPLPQVDATNIPVPRGTVSYTHLTLPTKA